MASNLKPMQSRFVEEYMKTPDNATEAAIRAGYSPHTARTTAAQILKRPHVQRYLQLQMDRRAWRTEVSLDRVVEEIARVAFANYTSLVTKDGRLEVDLSQADEGQLAAIAEITQDVIKEGEDYQILRTRVKLHNKLEALSALMKHLLLEAGKPTERTEVNETRNINIKAWMDQTAKEIGLVQWEREREKDGVQ